MQFRHTFIAITSAIALLNITTSFAGPPSLSKPELKLALERNNILVKSLGKSLKKELSNAIQTGGLSAGVQRYNVSAPTLEAAVISSDLAQEQVIYIGRRTLKARNTNNQPNMWQRQALETFDAQQKQGEQIKAQYRIVNHSNKKAIEFISPIATAGLCLNCHGENITPKVSQEINHLYPEDKAVGYQAGDIRGGFVLLRYLEGL